MPGDVTRYTVVLTAQAGADLKDSADHISTQSRQNALEWLLRMLNLIDSLEILPARHAIAREGHHLGLELRQAVQDSHRVLYGINETERVVVVHRVLHSSRDYWRR